jgi:hypothetical protein
MTPRLDRPMAPEAPERFTALTPPTAAVPRPVFLDARGHRRIWVRAAFAAAAVVGVGYVTVVGLLFGGSPTTMWPRIAGGLEEGLSTSLGELGAHRDPERPATPVTIDHDAERVAVARVPVTPAQAFDQALPGLLGPLMTAGTQPPPPTGAVPPATPGSPAPQTPSVNTTPPATPPPSTPVTPPPTSSPPTETPPPTDPPTDPPPADPPADPAPAGPETNP